MNIFCPSCENEYSEAAAACPKCGHALADPLLGPCTHLPAEHSAWWEDPVGAFVRWGINSLRLPNARISWTRTIGALMLAGFTVFILVGSMVAFLRQDPHTMEAYGRLER